MTRRPTLQNLLTAGMLALLSAGAASAQAPPATPPAPPPAAAPAAPAPRQDLTLILNGAQRPLLKLAFPALSGIATLSAPAASAAREIEQTLRDDLEASRLFAIQGPAELGVLTLTGDAAKDAEQYLSLGNEVLLAGEVKEEDGKVALEGRILDLKSGQSILGKRYRGDATVARRIAHTFADEIVLYFTGKRGIALTSIAFYSDRDGAKEIYLMDADGRNQRRITAHKSISMSPVWSPRGDQIAYVSFFDGPPSIYLVDVATGTKRPVVADGPLNISPCFSPDGKQIVFARSLSGNTEIFAANVDGKNLRQLTHSPGIDTNPAWSPNGREIAFTSSRSGDPHIYVMDAEGTNVRRVTFEGEYNDGAAWRPDGTAIVYATRHGNAFELAVTDVVTLQSREITSGPGSKEAPSFSPDGRRIVYESSAGGSRQIWSVGSDGTGAKQLTTGSNNSGPDWSGYPPN
jgi:TolB protein